MAFDAKVILDSLCVDTGARISTVSLTYPRFIHAEFMTHRDRARNAASSRAIPFPVMTERIDADPVVPLQWLSDRSGMQGGAEIPEALRPLARAIWLEAYHSARTFAQALHALRNEASGFALQDRDPMYGFVPAYAQRLSLEERAAIVSWANQNAGAEEVRLHKSIPNRLVEPWMWITVLTTATSWKNFFRLRCHSDAEIHFQRIAGMCRDVLEASKPQELNVGDWHRPYIDAADRSWVLRSDVIEEGPISLLNRISTARCARVSYLTHEGKRDPAKDLQLYDKLVTGSGFGHWSPHEHVACAMHAADLRSGPFNGWTQFRKMHVNECAD